MKVGDRVLVEIFDGEKFVDIVGISKGRGFAGRGEAASVCRWSEVARFDVPDHRFDRILGISVARVQRDADVGTHGKRRRSRPATCACSGVDKDENLLVVEGSVPGPQGGYIVITKAKKPPRERRGFAGSATVDPLKAAKRAAKKARQRLRATSRATISGQRPKIGRARYGNH